MNAQQFRAWLRIAGVLVLSGTAVAAQAPPVEVPPDARRTILDLVFAVEDVDIDIEETDEEIRLRLTADILFDFDEATIKVIAFETLQRVADEIGMRPGRVVRIEGHTDARGSDAYNQDLSARRARSVRDWLAEEGQLQDVDFETQGFGASNPIAPNTRDDGSDDPLGRQQNRRVEIVLSAG